MRPPLRPRAAAASRRPVVVAAASPSPPRSPPPGFAAPHADAVRVAILGDLHLDARATAAFDEAAAQLRAALDAGAAGGAAPRLVQLGDLGSSRDAPGTTPLFRRARAYLRAALPPGAPPPALVVGNHDLEGVSEFDGAVDAAADAAAAARAADGLNLAAWSAVFDQSPAWAARLGPALAVGLSTTTWRSNRDSVHEVAIPAADIEWLEDTVADAARAGTPVFVFTHAPPAGCGLRVVQSVHVRNRCAFLNHADRAAAARFVALAERHPNVAAWFSGHYHLSHNYATSLSVVNRTVFAQVGVIGPGSSRDGVRQSRLLDVGGAGWRLWSVDHGARGALRLDVDVAWGAAPAPRPVPPADLLDPAADAAWLASAIDCSVGGGDGGDAWPAAGGAAAAAPTAWVDGGADSLLEVQAGGAVVEYSARLRCPVGYVFDGLPPGATVQRVARDGAVLADGAPGDAAAELRAVAPDGAVVETRRRNYEGGWSHVYQANKWRKARLERERERRQAAGVV